MSEPLSYAFGYSGMAYLNQKKYAEATDMTRKAVFRAQQGNFPEILYYWQWQSGKIFNAIGETKIQFRHIGMP
ncbi:MAG: hypothetical protein HC887_01845 [Desulfobacteraceae bacterium]|nr:hypothetical protein [Desulfobacteraceae bacterium]